MNKKIRKLILLALALILVLALGACTPGKVVTEDPVIEDPVIEEPVVEEPVTEDPVVEDPIEDEIVDPTPEAESKEVTLYFANNEYVETGDEALEQLLPEQRVVEYGDLSLEESIVRELMIGPEDTDTLSTVIPETVELIDVELTDGTALVNFAQEGMGGASMQEVFTINQIIASLLELDSVDRVQFLIDGQVAESLMGHISIEEPFEHLSE